MNKFKLLWELNKLTKLEGMMNELKTKTIITSLVNLFQLFFGEAIGLTGILENVGIDQGELTLALVALAQIFQRWGMKK